MVGLLSKYFIFYLKFKKYCSFKFLEIDFTKYTPWLDNATQNNIPPETTNLFSDSDAKISL